ncbi:hypothetical protein [Sinomicrobium weinanense]|uniref:hypothetical protein n=1 Tax=Sinomicrobium weinanense TaxID=2842200 RepID=UPI001FFC705F|nr:hypothetical protein [Sinomicrobium weinanense]
MSGKKTGVQNIKVHLDWNKNDNNKQIIKEVTDRTLFQVSDTLQSDMESILTYDFDPQNANAEKAVLRLFRYIAKTPEYQLI